MAGLLLSHLQRREETTALVRTFSIVQDNLAILIRLRSIGLFGGVELTVALLWFLVTWLNLHSTSFRLSLALRAHKNPILQLGEKVHAEAVKVGFYRCFSVELNSIFLMKDILEQDI